MGHYQHIPLARSLRRGLALALLLTLVLASAPPARADILPASIVVNATNDTNIDNGQCSITEAMQTAIALRPNDDCGPEVSGLVVITFTVGTITLTDQLPNPVDGSNVSLLGPVIINSGPTLPLDVDGGTLNLANLTLTKSTTTVLNVHTDGTANVAGVSFVGNSSISGGAAIANAGTLRIAGSNFTGNKSTNANGGAIQSSGDLLIAGSVFNGNITDHSGGAISISGGEAEIDDTIFNGNIATGDAGYGGGAIYIQNSSNLKPVKITRSVFNGNLSTKGGGGAIFHNDSNTNTNASLQIRSSSFQGNLAGIPVSDPRPGGAILNWGTIAISNTVFMNNGASNNGGALANGDADSGVQVVPPQRFGRFSITNSTFTANAAAGKGGAIANYYVADGQVGTIVNTTFSANVAQEGGAIYSGEPKYDLVTLANTIVDGNLPGNCADPDNTTPTVISNGHNLDSGTSCGFNQAGDINSQSADLDTPAFNGGPLAALLSQKLNPGSPAIDAGDQAICAGPLVNNEDQRGDSRPKDGDGIGGAVCDMGAIEGDTVKAGFGSTPVQPGPIDFGNVTFGAQQDASISVFSTGNKTLQLSGPQIGGPNAADFALVTSFPLSVSSPTPVTLRCKPTGSTPGPRTATFSFSTNDSDHPSVSYTLTCNAVAQPAAGFGSTPDAPGPLDFGDVLVGQTKSGKITVKELGNATLTANNPALGGANPGDFSLGGGFNLTLTDGHVPVDVTVSCTPTAPGLRTATLTVTTNDPTALSVLFNLSCTGVTPPPLALDTASATSVDGSLFPMANPYGVAISPDGKNLYVVSQTSDTLQVFARDPLTGQLGTNPIQEIQDHTQLDGAIRVYVSPDGKNVYVTTYNANRILAYARNQTSGLLTLLDSVADCTGVGCLTTQLASPYGVVISPDGQYLYVSSIYDNAITIFKRDTDGGLRGPVNPLYVGAYTHAGLGFVYDLALSSDGVYLYAASYDNSPSSIMVLKRNAIDGTLSYVDTVDSNQVAGLGGVFRLAISPDGAQIYSGSFDNDAVTAFQRNPASGKLTHIATYTDGGLDAIGQTIDGLDAATSVAFSPDGAVVYASGYYDNAVAAFERDPASGELTFIQTIKRNPAPPAAGVPPLYGARDIAVGPEGRTIHVSAFSDNKVVTLARPNPKPTLENLSPASATATPGAITLIVNGADFVPGAKVRWNNATDLATTFVNSSQLKATVSVGLLASAGTRPVTVVNPTPGGGASNTLNFTITQPNQNPVPSIDELNPAGALAGGPALVLTVKGANFIAGSKVRWNGVDRPTTFLSATTLQVQVAATDVDQPGDAAVTVFNPAPGGGTSNAAAFNVAAPGENPVPAITILSPAFVTAGASGSIELVILGSNFVPGAQAQWNGEDRPTTFVNSGQLRMNANGADLVAPAQASVQVVNPAPGGGPSNIVTFRVGSAGENPQPVLTSIAGITSNANGLTLTLTGSGFIAGSHARWKGANRTTTFVSATQVKITITAADFAGSPAMISVVNPAPGGGASNELLYTTRRVNLPFVRR
ncbi:MAG: beta-propeller fold lactonase family protein [Roseiflexaceae bacterium]